MPETKDEINFAPKYIFQDTKTIQYVSLFISKNMLKSVVIISIVAILVFLTKVKLNRNLISLRGSIVEKQQTIENFSDVEKEFLQMSNTLVLMDNMLNRQVDWAQRLDDFTARLPQDMVLQKAFYTRGEIVFEAKVSSVQSFGVLIRALIADEKIGSIVLTKSEYNPVDQTYEFLLEMDIND